MLYTVVVQKDSKIVVTASFCGVMCEQGTPTHLLNLPSSIYPNATRLKPLGFQGSIQMLFSLLKASFCFVFYYVIGLQKEDYFYLLVRKDWLGQF